MSPELKRSLMWLPGPVVAVALVAFSVLGNAGPGFLFFSLTAGVAFMFVAPLLQAILLSLPKYKGRYGAACRVAMFVVLVVVLIPLFLGVFSFW